MVDTALQVTTTRSCSPPCGDQLAGVARGTDHSERVFYNFVNNLAGLGRLLAGGRYLQPRGYLRGAATAGPEFRLPTAAEAVAVDSPHFAHQLRVPA
jgi:hypothetical protein